MLRNVGRLDSLTRSIDGAPSDADQALEFNNPKLIKENVSILCAAGAKIRGFGSIILYYRA